MRPVRVLHVLGALNRGGVETWLMHVLRHIDRTVFQTDFLVHTDGPAEYDEQARALGSHIFQCPYTQNPPRYAARFLQILGRHGPFDILHSHVHHYSGLTLTLGRMAGIPVRIAHSHSDTGPLDTKAGLIRKAYLEMSSRLIAANCTHGLAVSGAAAASLYGQDWRNDHRFRILYCGIDAAPADADVSHGATRAEFGFPARSIVVGHVGRFHPEKNHAFLLETAAEITRLDGRARFLFVGDGPLRTAIEARSRALGLTDRVVFAGLRPDVWRLMRGAMDLLLLPSAREGLPLVLLEAQAAALTSVVSDAITVEAIIHPSLVRRLPLAAGPRVWAEFIMRAAEEPRFDSRRAGELFAASPFEIGRAVRALCGVYLERSAGEPQTAGQPPMAPAGRDGG